MRPVKIGAYPTHTREDWIMTDYRVEWTAVDHTGSLHRYVSHQMPKHDAEVMARTLRGDAAVLGADEFHPTMGIERG